MIKVLISIFFGAVIAVLIILGNAFAKDLENYYTKEKYPDPDGKMIGYMFYAAAVLLLAVTYFFLG